ncbi:hypothetical protein [Glaciecola petra]|uniref:Uncharacterized protein n=1 Tax=Glaciecola petra TaxID=3075602 RepID=A0ABU2ZMQ9_9ALTE|nr:hypothetical protein [Aestuariibacter sp. P117]MDT0593913.1 hypothetical protein [Aestuariibacter sp. P117]
MSTNDDDKSEWLKNHYQERLASTTIDSSICLSLSRDFSQAIVTLQIV